MVMRWVSLSVALLLMYVLAAVLVLCASAPFLWMPVPVKLAVFDALLACGIYLLFSTRYSAAESRGLFESINSFSSRPPQPMLRRLSAAYLAAAGLNYLQGGLLGLFPQFRLVEVAFWEDMISPYLSLELLHAVKNDPHGPIWDRIHYYYGVPEGDHYGFSAVVVAASLMAIIAAFGMAKSDRIAFGAGLCLLGASIISLVGYLILGLHSWGIKAIAVQLCWEASYIAAFLLARRGVVSYRLDTISLST